MVSVVIPTFNRSDLLDACLTALIETAPATEVLIVDEGLPFAEQCNLGFDRSSGELVVFLNDDTIPHVGWLEALTVAFEDPRVGMTGAKLLYPDGRIQHAGVYFDRPAGVLTAHNRTTDTPSRFVQAVTGACMCVRRTAFADVGGFDEGFVNGYEDVDLCLRFSELGWRIWYAANAVVTHHESASGEARWTHVHENIARLQEKHGSHHGS